MQQHNIWRIPMNDQNYSIGVQRFFSLMFVKRRMFDFLCPFKILCLSLIFVLFFCSCHCYSNVIIGIISIPDFSFFVIFYFSFEFQLLLLYVDRRRSGANDISLASYRITLYWRPYVIVLLFQVTLTSNRELFLKEDGNSRYNWFLKEKRNINVTVTIINWNLYSKTRRTSGSSLLLWQWTTPNYKYIK